jgi:hypothetical protein
MTESAKQGTTKAPAQTAKAGPAATESAAPQGDAEQETAARPAPDAPAHDGTAKAGESVTRELDETKRKFREALERKHQAHSEGQGKGNRDGGKINGAHGPAGNRRNFRRKSG